MFVDEGGAPTGSVDERGGEQVGHDLVGGLTTLHRPGVEEGLYDSVTVLDENDDEVRVYNWISVKTEAKVRGSNPVFQQFGDAVEIGAGDSWMDPDAVTEQVAEELQDARGIDVRDHGIRVIDPTAEEVDVV